MSGRALVLGALMAGIVDLALGLGGAALWGGAALESALGTIGLTMQATVGVAVSHTLQRLVFGASTVWLYVAMRPRFARAGPTAIAAGLTAWLMIYVLSSWYLVAMGIFPLSLGVALVAWGLPEMVITTFAGAWIYERASR
ncbi:MAG TPA: hypothetical protein VGA37_08040 [Gemmatimonadales bacterium]